MTKFGKIALLLLLCATTVGGFLVAAAGGRAFANPTWRASSSSTCPAPSSAYLATAVAAWYAVRYLRHRDLRDDIKSRAAFGLALVFWVLTTVTGAIFAKAQWGAYWNWDIKQSAILMLLLDLLRLLCPARRD